MNRVTKWIHGLLDPEAHRPDPTVAAELAARLPDDATEMDTARLTTMELAARLDGGLDGNAQDRLDRVLAGDGRDLQELAASAELVDTVAARLAAAPADLVAQAMVPPTSTPTVSPRRWAPWLWVSGAVLATALAAVLVLHRLSPPPADKGVIMAAPGPAETPSGGAPRMVPAGNADTVPPATKR